MYNNHHSQLIGTGRLDVFGDRVLYTSYVTSKTTTIYNVRGSLWREDFGRLSEDEKMAEVFKAYFQVEDKVFSTVSKLAESLSAFGIRTDPPKRLELSFGTLDGVVYRIGQRIVLPNERALPYMADLKQALNILIQSIGEHPKALNGVPTDTLVTIYRMYLEMVWQRHGLNQPMHNTYTITPEGGRSDTPLIAFLPKLVDLLSDRDCPDLKSEGVEPIINFISGLQPAFFHSQFVVFYAKRKTFYTFPKTIPSNEFVPSTVGSDDLYDAFDNLQYVECEPGANGRNESRTIVSYYLRIAQEVPDLFIVYEPTTGPGRNCVKWNVFNFFGE